MAERIHAITMPKWGMTMTEGRIASWLAEEGAPVSAGQEVVEIETTKITNVMEASASGVLRRRVLAEGATAPVGSLLGIVAEPDVPDADIDGFLTRFEAPAATGEGTEEAESARILESGLWRINVRSTGAGAGTPIVLIHGFGGDLNSWLFNQPALSDDRIVHALDLPGHGASPPTEGDGSVPDLAGAVVAALDVLGCDRAHLVGHSLGGAIALLLAIKAPQRVASATLIAPGGLGPEIDMAFIEGFIAADRRKEMKEVLGLLFADPDAVQRQMVEESLRYKRLDGVGDVLRKIAGANFAEGKQAGGMRAALASLKVPVQVIWGLQDGIIPASQAEGLPEAVAVHVIESAGHMPHMEEPGTVNRLIGTFIAAQP